MNRRSIFVRLFPSTETALLHYINTERPCRTKVPAKTVLCVLMLCMGVASGEGMGEETGPPKPKSPFHLVKIESEQPNCFN